MHFVYLSNSFIYVYDVMCIETHIFRRALSRLECLCVSVRGSGVKTPLCTVRRPEENCKLQRY